MWALACPHLMGVASSGLVLGTLMLPSFRNDFVEQLAESTGELHIYEPSKSEHESQNHQTEEHVRVSDELPDESKDKKN